jgi:hypothetical protein
MGIGIFSVTAIYTTKMFLIMAIFLRCKSAAKTLLRGMLGINKLKVTSIPLAFILKKNFPRMPTLPEYGSVKT